MLPGLNQSNETWKHEFLEKIEAVFIAPDFLSVSKKNSGPVGKNHKYLSNWKSLNINMKRDYNM